MNEIQKQIETVWAVEQEILDVVHSICMQHGLRYSLAYGTLLGAVRHGGFIPWDDDIDIMMPREDYDKLLAIWQQTAPSNYILVNKENNSDFYNNFAKIVKDHTTFLQFEEDRNKKFPKGIFVDIFPADRVAPGKISKKIQFAFCAVNLLLSRGYSSGTAGVIGAIEKMILCLPSRIRMYLYKWTLRVVSRWNKNQTEPYIFPCTLRACKKYHSAELFEDVRTISFNGRQYSSVKNTDQYLKREYGDYMQFPPVEDRVWKHHPIILNINCNYDEINN